MANTDIILDKTTYDLVFTTGGDFTVAVSEQQEVNLLLNTALGNWFEHPLVGVGIMNFLASSEDPLILKALIRDQMVADGFIIEDIKVKGTTIDNIDVQITAHR